MIEMVFCERWDIGKVFSDGSSLENQQFFDSRGWDFVIDWILERVIEAVSTINKLVITGDGILV